MRTLVSLLLCWLLLCSCGGAGPVDGSNRTGEGWPPGTVLAISGEPILASEVEAAALWVELIDPEASPTHRLRLALANVNLPIVVTRQKYATRHAEVMRVAEAAGRAATESPEQPAWPQGVESEVIQGTWHDLSIPTWAAARELPIGTWSETIEDIGAFVLVRVDERIEGTLPAELELKLTRVLMPYAPLGQFNRDPGPLFEGRTIEIVDPNWRDICPARWFSDMQEI